MIIRCTVFRNYSIPVPFVKKSFSTPLSYIHEKYYRSLLTYSDSFAGVGSFVVMSIRIGAAPTTAPAATE
jgi:hypothetical protein